MELWHVKAQLLFLLFTTITNNCLHTKQDMKNFLLMQQPVNS